MFFAQTDCSGLPQENLSGKSARGRGLWRMTLGGKTMRRRNPRDYRAKGKSHELVNWCGSPPSFLDPYSLTRSGSGNGNRMAGFCYRLCVQIAAAMRAAFWCLDNLDGARAPRESADVALVFQRFQRRSREGCGFQFQHRHEFADSRCESARSEEFLDDVKGAKFMRCKTHGHQPPPVCLYSADFA